jgi:hypothetical protein
VENFLKNVRLKTEKGTESNIWIHLRETGCENGKEMVQDRVQWWARG